MGIAPPPTRIISWQQTVTESDPFWSQDAQRPRIYEFSNGRQFYRDPAVYVAPSDFGGLLDLSFILDVSVLS